MSKQAITDSKPNLTAWFLLILLSIVWGSSFILIKKALIAFSPLEVGALRISISVVAFLPFFIKDFKQIPWKKWPLLLLVGLTGTGIPAFLYPIAETQLSSSVTGILNSLTPLFALLIGILFFGGRLESNKFVGVLLGLFGAAILVWFSNGEGEGGGLNGYAMLVIFATICYATSVNTVKANFQDLDAITLSAAAFALIGSPALVYLLMQGTFTKIPVVENGWYCFGAVCVLALLGTVIASILFYKLLQMTNVVFSATVAYLIPVVAILLGVFDGEYFSMMHLAGMASILIGVYLSR